MDDLLKSMGKRLTVSRKQLRLTQEELAARANLTTQTVSTAETGRKALRSANIVKLCKALEISADYLLFGETSSGDISILSNKVSSLSTEQYRHLEDIVNSFIAAVASGEEEP